jgi:RHS repeat-associated protein
VSTLSSPVNGHRRSLVRRRTPRAVVLVLASALLGSLTVQLPAAPASAAGTAVVPEDVKGIKVQEVAATQHLAEWTAGDRELTEADLADLPDDGDGTGGTQVVTFSSAQVRSAAGGAAAKVTANGAGATGSAAGSRGSRVGRTPVYVAPAPTASVAAAGTSSPVGKVKVDVLSRKAAAKLGVDGLAVRVARADGVASAGQASVTVDYGQVAGRFGNGALSRLRLVRVSDGAMVPAVNDRETRTLTATVPLAAAGASTTLAVAAAAEGEDGSFKATSLSSASTWQVSQQGGSFSWEYPLKAPAPPGGVAPSLGFSYNSSAIDGLTSGNNTQGSWIGDGWDMWPGYIERSYRSCVDDHDEKEKANPNNKDEKGGDLCYFDDNATMSFNGSASELVKVASTDSGSGDKNIEYRSVSDDGSRIEWVKAGYGNGDEDGAYWRVTDTDGTQYYYGRDKGQGGSSADTETNSVFTVPVYSNHPDDPGYNSDFSKSRHDRAWRWNLDYVVDPSGNTVTYFYTKEGGAYAREFDKDKRTTYDRGGYLNRVEYGSRTDAASSVRPADRIVFDTVDRCIGTCRNSDDKPIAKRWPDTPWDQYCAEAPCKDTQYNPTFWTQKRLSKVRAQVYSGSGDSYTDVDSWSLTHSYLTAGGTDATPMWLKSVTHTGEVTSAGGPAVTDPPVTFNPNADVMPNRVDTPTGHSSLFRSRIDTITTESGAQYGITYSKPDCDSGTLPKPWSNTKRCFPQYYGIEGETPVLDWFNKYVVTRVDIYDYTNGFDHQQTNYDYLDSPAWAYDDSELVRPKKRTWGQYRGYGRVRVRSGVESQTQSAVEYRYFRGMDGDEQPKDAERPPTGTPRSVQVTDSLGGTVTDDFAFQGMLREQITYDGVGGDWISGTLNTPVKTGPTASSGPLKAWRTHVETSRARLKLASGSTRWTKTVTKVNDDNFPNLVDDLGDESTAADDRCSRTEYAVDRDDWMLDRVKRVETVGVTCSLNPTRPDDVLSDSRTYYDDPDTYGATPTRGLPVRTEELDSWSGTTPKYVTTSRTGYDKIGRPTSQADGLGRTTTTTYTPELTGPVTQFVVTNPLGQATTTTLNPALAAPVKTVDPNKGTTEVTYDGDGRLLAVWPAGRSRSTYPNDPSTSYSYQLRKTASSSVTTKTLVAAGTTNYYRTKISLYDGLLRERQTQTQTIGGGRAITETVYDSRGLVDWASNPYYDIDNTAPNTTLVTAVGHPEIPAITENEYDGAGRNKLSTFVVNGDKKWWTTTTYAGERTNVTPPSGGTATTRIVDARGRLAELRQYKTPAQVGSDTASTFDRTTYAYTDRDELKQVVDPGGNAWTYGYDLHGNQNSAGDPDKGATSSTYDVAGQLMTTKDARSKVLGYTFDKLGRKETVRQNSTTGPILSEWTYDTATNGIGRPATATRYEYDSAGKASKYVNAVVGYDIAGQPLSSTLTIPSSEGGLCASKATDPCTYTQSTAYTPNEMVESVTLPAVADLASEKVQPFRNNATGLPTGLGGKNLYAQAGKYNQLDQPIYLALGDDAQKVFLTYGYDEPTGRLTTFEAIPNGKADIYHLTYGYDPAGNLISAADVPDSSQTPETQCYSYDYLRRLTNAWTPTSPDCSKAAAVTSLSGPAPYWRSYTFDVSGNRKTETVHGTTNTVRTYAYPSPAGAAGSRPHGVTSVSSVTGSAAAVTSKYHYDLAGNMDCRPQGTVANTCPTSGTDTAGQVLAWNDEDRLAKLADKTGETSYVYDADGNRLIRRDPTGSTLYLPGGQEVRKPKSGDATATRYYSFTGQTIAVRTAAALTWMVSDYQGTGSATVSLDLATVQRRRELPFGAPRGTAPASWAGDKGFLGGTKDNTGLTHLGAREYDPVLGRFVSVDPVMDLSQPDQWNGYSYANDNPVTFSDPSGLKIPTPADDAQQAPAPAPTDPCKWAPSIRPAGCGSGNHVEHDGADPLGARPHTYHAPSSGVTVWFFYTRVSAPTQAVYTNAFLATKKKWNAHGGRDPQEQCMSLDSECQGADVLDVVYFAQDLCERSGITCPGHPHPLAQAMGQAVAGGMMAGGEGFLRGGGSSGASRINWSAKSSVTFGHTFSRHGAGGKNTQNLIGRAATSGKDQGQWLDNDEAAIFLRSVHLPDAQPRTIDIPEGLGQVIRADGSIVPARQAFLVPSRNGLYKSAYPIIK